MKEKWLKWAALEGIIRVSSNFVQKTVGELLNQMGPVFYLTALIGLVQAVLGWFVARRMKEKILIHWVGIVGSISFGLFAVLAIIFTFLVFANNGPLSGHVFIVTLSIIPGALLERLVFGYRFRCTQVVGILVAVLAGYCVLLPSIGEMHGMPVWVGFSVLSGIMMTINQAISQKIQAYTTPMAKNVWGGLTIFLAASASFIVAGGSDMGSFLAIKRLTFASLWIGILSVFLWTFNLWAYQGGAYIALKKLVVNGTLIIAGLIGGALQFGEEVTILQVIGFGLYLVAFVLVDRDTWVFVRGKIQLAWA